MQDISRLLYRARQRGWLELDLLVGLWAEREVAHLSPAALKDFEYLLLQENPDLFKWITGQSEPPDDMQRNVAFQVCNFFFLCVFLSSQSLSGSGACVCV